MLAGPGEFIAYSLSLVVSPAAGAYLGGRLSGEAKELRAPWRGIVPSLFVGVFMPTAVIPPIVVGAIVSVAGIGEPKYLSSKAEILGFIVICPMIISLVAFCAWTFGVLCLERFGAK